MTIPAAPVTDCPATDTRGAWGVGINYDRFIRRERKTPRLGYTTQEER
ncbi:MAG TPA: hypothetical protein VME86_04985 [Acidobacteriaceae bacterium]|nr:hypothetical protein [Acidobacteriaceae bacterium]